jgi:nitrile hydratase beta subunit
MDGIHDLGGRAGLGPIVHADEEPVFHSAWERSVLVMFPAMAMAGAFNLDQFRSGMEQIPPHEYLTSRYYEHWMHSMLLHGVEAGIFDPDELEKRTQYYLEHPDEEVPRTCKPEMVETLQTLIAQGDVYDRPTDRGPQFQPGDKVRVRAEASVGHTRRAGYVRGRTGVVTAAHGSYVYPDRNAAGKGEDPQHVYTVAFTSQELWGDDQGATVHIDLWEPYLTPA